MYSEKYQKNQTACNTHCPVGISTKKYFDSTVTNCTCQKQYKYFKYFIHKANPLKKFNAAMQQNGVKK